MRDSWCLIDLIDYCVQESAPNPPPTDELEECLLDSVKNDKENIEAKVYEKLLDKSPIFTNQSFNALVTQSDKPKQQKTQLGLKQGEPKQKKGVKKSSMKILKNPKAPS